MARILDLVFFIYFATHIPISILVDFQSVLPLHIYPQTLIDVRHWYCRTFKDPMMMSSPAWYNSFVFCEFLVQFPFFPIAAYGFFKGAKKCQWLRIPSLIYGIHVATTLIPIFAHILFHDFSHGSFGGPTTVEERLFLMSVYIPYFIIPVLMALDALFSSVYISNEKID